MKNKAFFPVAIILTILVVVAIGIILLISNSSSTNQTNNNISNVETSNEGNIAIEEKLMEEIVSNDGDFDYNQEDNVLPTVEPTLENESTTKTPNLSNENTTQAKTVKIIYIDRMTSIEPIRKEFTETTNRSDVLTFAIEKLINGYGGNDITKGFKDRLTGESNCPNQKDFTASVSNGVATIKMCRNFIGGGTMYDASVLSSFQETAKQFSTVQKVVVLDKNGNCLLDQSGLNTCLN